jgi:hypothetical protein
MSEGQKIGGIAQVFGRHGRGLFEIMGRAFNFHDVQDGCSEAIPIACEKRASSSHEISSTKVPLEQGRLHPRSLQPDAPSVRAN